MTRKGWNWREESDGVTPDTVTEIIKIHNFNNEKAWQEVGHSHCNVITSSAAPTTHHILRLYQLLLKSHEHIIYLVLLNLAMVTG